MFLPFGALKRPLPIRFSIIAAALPALCFAQDAPASATEDGMDVQCQIRTDETSGFVRLDAVAVSNASITGTYQLQVVKRGTGGSSQNLQSGRFALAAGRPEVLSSVILDASAHNAYAARLDVAWDKGTRTCTTP
ncbi:curli-like amyloid fiber formation chaperone CsgH [Microvirga sp. TS319]|uniref:curli-like amyloid fiber formation chaperone CsgH n=1 Tax=Microvirga sp. TS319 TaxID=3241165 RepID=UPI00351A7963